MSRMKDTPETTDARALVIEAARAVVEAADRSGADAHSLDIPLHRLKVVMHVYERAWDAALWRAVNDLPGAKERDADARLHEDDKALRRRVASVLDGWRPETIDARKGQQL